MLEYSQNFCVKHFYKTSNNNLNQDDFNLTMVLSLQYINIYLHTINKVEKPVISSVHVETLYMHLTMCVPMGAHVCEVVHSCHD